jgi:aerobic carbon-monoxide dehydrogenase small subunit
VNVAFRLNGDPVTADVPADVTLLDLLRTMLHLTGTKWGCRMGDCGACTVLVGDTASLACLHLAAQVDGTEVTTVEGLEQDGVLSDLQAALVAAGGIQCGFCTPGMLLAAEALLRSTDLATLDEETVRRGLSGNLCRCTGYPKIVQAVRSVARQRAVRR